MLGNYVPYSSYTLAIIMLCIYVPHASLYVSLAIIMVGVYVPHSSLSIHILSDYHARYLCIHCSPYLSLAIIMLGIYVHTAHHIYP